MHPVVLNIGRKCVSKFLTTAILFLLVFSMLSGTALGAKITDSDPDDGETEVPVDSLMIIRFNE
jgi:hypothetical protein